MAGHDLYVGLMSGTSLDGVDGVLADLSAPAPRVLAFTHRDFPPPLREELLRLQAPQADELHRAQVASLALADCYADTVHALAGQAGVATAAIRAVGAHGQTIRHRPESGYTLQLNAPARLAERTGITVVADFRSRDVAAGGQGAPLVPAFHAAVFGDPVATRIVVNVGGIANLSVLRPGKPVLGFDCGPGNVLMDSWIARHKGLPYDANGAWAASGRADLQCLRHLLEEPYFSQRPPKSTGRDLFNAAWLDTRLAGFRGVAPEDLQATLLALTATTIADAARPYLDSRSTLFLCGGGARNGQLLAALGHLLGPVAVTTTERLGVPVDQVEALAFAWLARAALAGQPGNLPSVTGAAGPRVLGAIYPA